MEKLFRDNGITGCSLSVSDADVLSFHDSLESNLKQKNTWEVPIHQTWNNFSQVNYKLIVQFT